MTVAAARQNRSVKDDIRDYWSIRAETYDLSAGHGRMGAREAAAWQTLIRTHLGPAKAAGRWTSAAARASCRC